MEVITGRCDARACFTAIIHAMGNAMHLKTSAIVLLDHTHDAMANRMAARIGCFFSSRRRHTRCSRDWSSDVCSSDLGRWEKSSSGAEVRGKTLGLIGLGRIGSEVASRAEAFDMRVVAFDPFISEAAARE